MTTSTCTCAWFTKRKELNVPLVYEAQHRLWSLMIFDANGKRSWLAIHYCPSCGGKANWGPEAPWPEPRVVELE